MNRILVFGFLLSVLFFSCKSGGDSGKLGQPNQPLGEKAWHLSKLGDVDIPIERKQPMSVEFGKRQADDINGYAGCNQFFGKFKVAGNKLTVSDLGRTQMACDDMANEEKFLAWLDKATTWSIEGDLLTIQCEQGTLIFKGHSYLPTGH